MTFTKDQIIDTLYKNKGRSMFDNGETAIDDGGKFRADCVQYADAFLEYQVASSMIRIEPEIVIDAESGQEKTLPVNLVMKDPANGKMISNPYIAIRDGALKKLRGFDLDVTGLW
jgi:hypothetical protein